MSHMSEIDLDIQQCGFDTDVAHVEIYPAYGANGIDTIVVTAIDEYDTPVSFCLVD